MALSLLLTRTTGLVVPSTGLCSRPALTAPLARMQMVSDEEEWEELDGGDTSESWEEQMAAMREWEATKDSTPDPVAPAASESDPDDVASALADVGAAMVQLGRSVEVLAARLNGASPPPARWRIVRGGEEPALRCARARDQGSQRGSWRAGHV